jgi:hypothetical protein
MSDPAIKVDVSLKAELPEDVIRQQSDAINDALSPFVHGLGYLGDKIKFIRFKSAIKMLQEAKSILDKTGDTIKAPPLKFLVPLIEDASLEEEESPLHEMWAGLLVAASKSEEFDAKLQMYREILKSIGPKEVCVLKELWDFAQRIRYFLFETDVHVEPVGRFRRGEFSLLKISPKPVSNLTEYYWSFMSQYEECLKYALSDEWNAHGSSASDYVEKLQKETEHQFGKEVQRFLFGGTTSDKRIDEHVVTFTRYDLLRDQSKALLSRLGLIERRLVTLRPKDFPAKPVTMIVGFTRLSQLGVDFVQNCKPH